MSFVKIQVSRFLNWVVEKNEVDSLESTVARFDELYESFANEYNVAGSVIDSLVQIAVEKPKKSRKPKNGSSVSELTMSDSGEIMLSDTVDGIIQEKEISKKPRAKASKKTTVVPDVEHTIVSAPIPDVVHDIVYGAGSGSGTGSDIDIIANIIQSVENDAKETKKDINKEIKVSKVSKVKETKVKEPKVKETKVKEPKVKVSKAKANKVPVPVSVPVYVAAVDADDADIIADIIKAAENTAATPAVDADQKKKRSYNKKPKALDTETNVIVVSPELVEEPILERVRETICVDLVDDTVVVKEEEEAEEEDAVELEEMTINDVTFYIDNDHNLYNAEFKLVGKLEGDNVVML